MIKESFQKNCNHLPEKAINIELGKNTLLAFVDNYKPDAKAANEILDRLSVTLNDIKVVSAKKYEENNGNFDENYKIAAEAAERLKLILLKTKFIQLIKKFGREENVYSSGKVTLDGGRGKKRFERINFFIRNEPRPAKVDKFVMNGYYYEGINLFKAQARIENLNTSSKQHINLSMIYTLIDPYNNIVDKLDLREAGQVNTHHFKLNYHIPDGVAAKNIYEILNKGLFRIAEKHAPNKSRQRFLYKT